MRDLRKEIRKINEEKRRTEYKKSLFSIFVQKIRKFANRIG